MLIFILDIIFNPIRWLIFGNVNIFQIWRSRFNPIRCFLNLLFAERYVCFKLIAIGFWIKIFQPASVKNIAWNLHLFENKVVWMKLRQMKHLWVQSCSITKAGNDFWQILYSSCHFLLQLFYIQWVPLNGIPYNLSQIPNNSFTPDACLVHLIYYSGSRLMWSLWDR